VGPGKRVAVLGAGPIGKPSDALLFLSPLSIIAADFIGKTSCSLPAQTSLCVLSLYPFFQSSDDANLLIASLVI